MCKKCNIEKEIIEFYKQRNKCKKCIKDEKYIYDKERYLNNSEIIKEKSKQFRLDNIDYYKNYNSKYRIDNIDKIKEYQIQYYLDNIEDFKEYQNEYYKENTQKIKDMSKKYRIDNIEYYKEYQRLYKINNIDKIKEYQIQYYIKNNDIINFNRRVRVKKRKNSDPLYKLICNIRSSISNGFRDIGLKKKSKTEEILGCTFEEFKIYIESKFYTWMQWNNHGLYNNELNYGWDLDHIIPLSSAKTEEEIISLNHYLNFQPLCSKVNRYIKMDII